MRILVVEDVEIMSLALKFALEKIGHQVTTTASVLEAEQELSSTTYDKIICDGNLDPKHTGDGLRLAARLHAEGKNVVIFSSQTKDLPEGVPYVTKSGNPETIKAMLG